MHDLQEQLAVAETKNRLNSLVAVSVALLAVFMAVTKVKDDNIVQAMLQTKSDAVDRWNEYQAKKLKHHLAELGLTQLQALQLLAPGKGVEEFSRMQKEYRDQIKRYQAEEERIMQQAKEHEKQYDELNYKDDQFDLSDAALSICMGMLAVTSLTNKRRLLYLSWLFAAFGVVMGLAGLFGLHIHPDFLAGLLS